MDRLMLTLFFQSFYKLLGICIGVILIRLKEFKLEATVLAAVVVKLGFQFIFHASLCLSYITLPYPAHEVVVVTPKGTLVVEEATHGVDYRRTCVKSGHCIGVRVEYIEAYYDKNLALTFVGFGK